MTTVSRDEGSSSHSLGLKAPSTPPVSLNSFEISFMDTNIDDDVLPELSFDQSTPSANTDETCSLDGVSPQGNISYPHTLEELEANMAQTLNDYALCSQFLRSPSPPNSHKEGDSGAIDNQISLTQQTINPRDICLVTERDPHLAELIDENASKLETDHMQTKKPRITLLVRHPNPAPKPKVSLRLSQPKKASTPMSVRRGATRRRRTRT